MLRFDLPHTKTPAILKRVATQVIGMVCKLRDVDKIVLAVHTDELISSGLPHAEFVSILQRRLQQAGFKVHDALCQAGNGWGSYLDSELPVEGHPLSDIEESAARLPPMMQPEKCEMEIPIASSTEKERMVEELAHYRAAIAQLKDSDPDPPEFEQLRDLPRFVEDALEWDAGECDFMGALLMFAIQGPPVRDATMLQWAFGFELGDVLYDEAERFAKFGLDPNDARSNMIGDLMLGFGPPPHRARIERGRRLLLTLVSRAEPSECCAPLCMLAWLSWAMGEGTQAGKFVDAARAIDLKYGMAELLDAVLSSGLLPEWIFADPDESMGGL